MNKSLYKTKNIPSKIYLWTIIIIFYIPIALTIVYSFNLSKLTSVWSGFSLHWYVELFKDQALMKAVGNSLILAISACTLSAAIGTITALSFFSSRSTIDKAVEGLLISPLMIPEIILAMGLMTAFTLFKLKFGMLTLIIAHTTFCVPYVYLMVKSRLENRDKTIEDAALDLGASRFRLFWDITFPEILPGILSGMLLSFAMSFDDVVISMLVTGTGVNTLPISIYTSIKTGVTPKINALITIMMGIIILAFILYAVFIKVLNKKFRKS